MSRSLLYFGLAFLCLWSPPVSVAIVRAAPSDDLAELRRIERKTRELAGRVRELTVQVSVGARVGSGVLLEERLVLTSAHVVGQADRIVTVVTDQGERRTARSLGMHLGLDVALLRLERPRRGPTARMRGEPPAAGEMVLAAGRPAGTATRDVVSLRLGSVLRSDGGGRIETDCRLGRGDSGGPLFDLDGQLVAIHRQIGRGLATNVHSLVPTVRVHWSRMLRGEVITGDVPAGNPTRAPQKDFDTASVASTARNAIVAIHNETGFLALGTIVDRARGRIVAKASCLTGQLRLASAAVPGAGPSGTSESDPSDSDGSRPVRVLAVDRQTDLALLEAEATFSAELVPAARSLPQVGALLVSVCRSGNRVGVVSVSDQAVASEKGELGLILEDTSDGPMVGDVLPNSAAHKAGLITEDVILAVDGVATPSIAIFAQAVQHLQPGDRFMLTLGRAIATQSAEMQVRHRADGRFANDVFQLGAAGSLSRRRTGFRSVVLHDTQITPQECGGPVLNLAGQFIGVNIARAGRPTSYLLGGRELQAALGRLRRSATSAP